MTRYSVQPRDQIFVKGYGFLSFAKNMGVNIDKNSQKLLDHTKELATDALNTASERSIPKAAEATDNLIGNKIADKIKRVSKTSHNNSKANEEEILRERYISPELRQNIIDDLIQLTNYVKIMYFFRHFLATKKRN